MSTTAEAGQGPLQWPRLKVLMTQPRLYSYRVVSKVLTSHLAPRSSLLAQFYWRQYWERWERQLFIISVKSWPGLDPSRRGDPPNIVCNVAMLPRPRTHPHTLSELSWETLQPGDSTDCHPALNTYNTVTCFFYQLQTAYPVCGPHPHPHPLHLMGH